MKAFVEFLAKLQHEESGEIRRIFKVCFEFERIARDVLTKARDNPHSQLETLGGGHGRQSVNAAVTAIRTPESAVAPSSASIPLLSGDMVQDSSGNPAVVSSQFTQSFPDMVGHTLNPYPEAQPMFPHGLTLPWNMNSFEGSMLPDSFANSSYDFDAND
jgi:hypothetical protein